jgi:hypothetical protein
MRNLFLLLVLPTQASGWQALEVDWRSAVAVTSTEPWPTHIHEVAILRDKNDKLYFGQEARTTTSVVWKRGEKVACTTGNQELTCTRDGESFFSWPYLTPLKKVLGCSAVPLVSPEGKVREAVLLCGGERFRVLFGETHINSWKRVGDTWSLLSCESGEAWLLQSETAHLQIQTFTSLGEL